MKKVKTALVGHGHLGKWHAQKASALETCDFLEVIDPSEKSQQAVKESYPEISIKSSIAEISDEIEAIVVSSPTSFHYDICKAALEKGLHIFCEKPLCETIEQANELKQLKDTQPQVKFQVGHSERFHKAWEMIKDHKILKENNLIIRINRYAPFKGRATDVDVVQDLMVHDLDLLVMLLSEMPSSVQSFGKKIRTDKWDHVQSDFKFKSGHSASITVGRNHVHERRDVEIIGESGCLYIDLFSNKILFAPSTQIQDQVFVSEDDYEKRDHLFLEQEHFYNSILNDQTEIVGIDDGINAVKLISRVLDSINKLGPVEI